ncbi:hypothetical protein ACAG25_08005 [Mycobacterium sp. pV006]|uniref:hypothetical protein n=1 Tax=Mycobacterium sp. pV006 TaxID=3238983 RepID=UPI00351B341B
MLTDRPVCSVCGEAAPDFPPVCGNAVRSRVVMETWVEGDDLAHLTRYMERVRDDDEVTEMRVVVRACGSLEFSAPGFIYSRPVGAAD